MWYEWINVFIYVFWWDATCETKIILHKFSQSITEKINKEAQGLFLPILYKPTDDP